MGGRVRFEVGISRVRGLNLVTKSIDIIDFSVGVIGFRQDLIHRGGSHVVLRYCHYKRLDSGVMRPSLCLQLKLRLSYLPKLTTSAGALDWDRY